MEVKLPEKCCDNPQRFIVAPVIGFECRNCGYRDCREHDPLIEELAEKIADHYCKDELLKEMAEALQGMADIYYGRDNQPIAGAFAKRMDDVLRKYHEQQATKC